MTMRAGAGSPRMRQAGAGLGLWAANLGVMAAGFLAPLALARLAAPEDYGRFSFVTAILATCSILTAPGLNMAVTQAAARGQHGALRRAAASRLRWSLLAAAVVALIGAALVLRGDRLTGLILIAVAPLVTAAYGLDVAAAFLNGAGRFPSMIAVMLASAALPAAAVVGLLYAGAPIQAVIAGHVLAGAVTNVLSLLVVTRRVVANDEVDETLLQYGRRLSWISSLGAVQFYFDRLVIGAALGFADLAIYSAAKIFQQGLKSTWAAANQLIFPALASRGEPGARALTRRTIVPLWLGFAGLFGLAAAALPFIVIGLFGAAYAPSITPARLLMLAVVAGIPGAQYEMLFRAVADERRLYVQRITFSILEVGFTGAGAWMYGVTGAAAGTVAAYALNSLVGFVLDRSK